MSQETLFYRSLIAMRRTATSELHYFLLLLIITILPTAQSIWSERYLPTAHHKCT